MKKRVFKITAIVILIIAVIFLITSIVAVAAIKKQVNFDVDEILFQTAKNGTLTRFFANSSTIPGEYVPIEIESMTMGRDIKSYYTLDMISDYLKDGFIAVEDKEFYNHDGVNFRRTAMALTNHLFKFGRSFGASTITQQVIKNISGDNEQTVKRKFFEIFRAIRIEDSYTKDEILELYLNIVPLGENVVGVGMGARHYFGKEPSELSADEAAILIGLANAPSANNPHSNPERCIKKRNTVLSSMNKEGIINDSEYERLIAKELSVIPKENAVNGVYSWFVETVIEEASSDYAKAHGITPESARLILLASGYSIYTTQNVNVQNVLDEYFKNLDNFPKECSSGLDFSMLVLDPLSADLLGIVGSAGEKSSNLLMNHAIVPHTPASTLKPIALYAPLIEEGKITWSTVFDDVPLEFINDIRPYPVNSPNVYNGLITVNEAIVYSKNTVAMRLYNLLGAEVIYDNLKSNYGINLVRTEYNSKGEKITDLAPAPLALGQLSKGIGLRKLTECYTAFASDGILSSGRSYTKVVDSKGNIVLEKTVEKKRVYSQNTARIMNQLLMNVTDHGTAKSIKLGNIVDTAGKTGTSGGNLEKLFVGYTPYLAGGIRCSYNDSKTAVEGSLHLAVWDTVMTRLHELYFSEHDEAIKSFSTEGLVYAPYCKDSGELFSENCLLDPRGSRLEYGYFMSENRPHELCKVHIPLEYDIETEGIAHSGCPSDSLIKIALIDAPKRSFPIEIIVLDAEYVYRAVGEEIPLGDSFDIPYFYYALPEGEYVGVGSKKKQFNHSCYLHD